MTCGALLGGASGATSADMREPQNIIRPFRAWLPISLFFWGFFVHNGGGGGSPTWPLIGWGCDYALPCLPVPSLPSAYIRSVTSFLGVGHAAAIRVQNGFTSALTFKEGLN